MDTKALRQKILDLAIRGKLVPQDPNDEPASVLLERIRAEKQQMVKDGKLKAKDIKNDTVIFLGDDNLHYEKFPDGTVKCIEDEIPFELPEGWRWDRLGNVSIIARGGSPRPIESYITDDENGINWIKIGDTEKDGKYIFKTKEKIKPEGLSKSRYVESGDFLLTNSMSFGRPYILRTDGCIHDGWLVIGNIDTVFNQDFLYYALSSYFMYQTLSLLAAGSTVKNLKSDTVKSVLFPIPPMREQKRIAEKIDSLISFVIKIESDKTDLQTTIQLTKSKILELAIRGKLVPQDPNDEPASILLERIRTEKEELIKQGKIKRDKKESVIFRGDDNSYYEVIASKTTNIDDDLPFELPDGWEWCRLGSIMDICSSKRVLQSEWKKEGVPFYRAREIVKLSETGHVDNDLFISEEHYQNLKKDYGIPKSGDLMVSGVGTIGKVYIVCENDKFYYKDASVLCFQNTYNALYPLYAKLLIDSSFMQKQMSDNSKGTTVDTITISTATTYLCILPPINEQKRIADKVSQLFSLLDSIAENVN